MTMWMKWIVFFTICQNTLCIEQPYRLVDANTTCLEIKVESRLSCNNYRGEFYHCLLDENYTKEYEVCRNWNWISGGKCAYFNPYGRGNVDERNCAGNSTKKCATEVYRSDLNMQYDACYVKKRIAITIPIVPVTVRSTGRGTSDVRNTTETAPTESTPAESAPFNSSAIGIAFGVIIPFILLIVAVILLIKKRRHTQDTRQRETAVERGEGDALMNTETCLEENEKNQLIEKENSMKNEKIIVSQNYDSPQKNESFKMPPTSPAVQTEPDADKGRTENKDDKKNEKKEGEESREGHNSSEEVSPGAGEEKKTEEGFIEGDPSVVEVLPDDGVKDDSNSSGDNGKQNTKVTEEDQNERTENASNEIKNAVGIFVDSLESITKEDDDREQHYSNYSVA